VVVEKEVGVVVEAEVGCAGVLSRVGDGNWNLVWIPVRRALPKRHRRRKG
jgi:hypothetical protein